MYIIAQLRNDFIYSLAQPANLNNDTINNQANHLPNGVIGRGLLRTLFIYDIS
jgi:hypothetical protein